MGYVKAHNRRRTTSLLLEKYKWPSWILALIEIVRNLYVQCINRNFCFPGHHCRDATDTTAAFGYKHHEFSMITNFYMPHGGESAPLTTCEARNHTVVTVAFCNDTSLGPPTSSATFLLVFASPKVTDLSILVPILATILAFQTSWHQ